MKHALEVGELDLGRHSIARDGRVQRLSSTESNLLAYLVARPGEAVSRAELLRAVWGHERDTVTRAVDVAVTRLRVKIERDPAQPNHLITVHGQGYVWVPLTQEEAAPAAVEAPTNVWLEIGSARVNLRALTVEGPNGTASLSGNEALLLRRLDADRGETVSREALIHAAWGLHAEDSRALDHAMGRLRGKVEVDPKNPVWLQTVRGVGYRLVPSARTTPPPIPSPSGAFFERQDLIDRVRHELSQRPRLLTLHGPGGVGKTRLAIEVARLEERRCWFLDLADVETPDRLCEALASTLALPAPDAGTTRADQIGRALSGLGVATLLLDNADRTVAALRTLLPTWLASCPDSRFLLTSRHVLGLREERVVSVDPLTTEQSARLFRWFGERAGATFAPDDAQLMDVVALLDGLPLALEIAASRLKALSLDELEARLQAPLQLLRRPGSSDALSRTLETSWELLSDPLREAWVVASWFRGGFDLPALSAVLGSDALDSAEGLLGHALLFRAPLPGSDRARFRMLDTVRAFGLQRLADHPTPEAVRKKHAEHFVRVSTDLAHQQQRTGAPSVVRALEADRGNLEQALDHAPTLADRIALARALAILLALRGALPEQLLRYDALVLEASGSEELLARALMTRAQIRIASAEPSVAEDLRKVVAMFPPDTAEHLEARALFQKVAIRRRDPGVVAFCRESVALARGRADRRALGEHLSDLGHALSTYGSGEAQDTLAEALAIAREVDHQGLVGATLRYMGMDHSKMNQPDLAMRCFRESIQVHTTLGDRGAVATLTMNIGQVRSSADGAPIEEGIEAHLESARLWRSLGSAYGEAMALTNAAIFELVLRRHIDAEVHTRSALSLLDRLGLPGRMTILWSLLGMTYQDSGQVERARAAHASAGRIANRDVPGEYAYHVGMEGIFELEHGSPERAASLIESALRIFESTNLPRAVDEMRHFLALSFAVRGDPQKALELWNTADGPPGPPRRFAHRLAVRACIHLAEADSAPDPGSRERALAQANELMGRLRDPSPGSSLLDGSEDARVAARLFDRVHRALPSSPSSDVPEQNQ